MAEISKTADQALAILIAVAEHQPVPVAGLCRELGMNRSVAHRLLTTLRQRGFVRRVGDDYVLGPALARLASQAAPTLRQAAEPVMEGLAADVGETIVLQVIDGEQAIILAQAIGRRHVVRVEQNLIASHPLHLGASGRVLLAYQAGPRIRQILAGVPNAGAVARELPDIRKRGYALSHDELQWGVHAVSAPVLGSGGTAVAALAALIPVNRASRVSGLIGPVVAAAGEIGAALLRAHPGASAVG
jgi:IclR family transcriptional regulator, KDG regulon repressor